MHYALSDEKELGSENEFEHDQIVDVLMLVDNGAQAVEDRRHGRDAQFRHVP